MKRLNNAKTGTRSRSEGRRDIASRPSNGRHVAARCHADKDLFTICEAAEYLDCTEYGIHILIYDEKLSLIKQGGRVLIKREDLDWVLIEDNRDI